MGELVVGSIPTILFLTFELLRHLVIQTASDPSMIYILFWNQKAKMEMNFAKRELPEKEKKNSSSNVPAPH